MFLVLVREGKYFHCQYPSDKRRHKARLTLAKYRLCASDILAEVTRHYNLFDPGGRWVRGYFTKIWTSFDILVMDLASWLSQIKKESVFGPVVPHKPW